MPIEFVTHSNICMRHELDICPWHTFTTYLIRNVDEKIDFWVRHDQFVAHFCYTPDSNVHENTADSLESRARAALKWTFGCGTNSRFARAALKWTLQCGTKSTFVRDSPLHTWLERRRQHGGLTQISSSCRTQIDTWVRHELDACPWLTFTTHLIWMSTRTRRSRQTRSCSNQLIVNCVIASVNVSPSNAASNTKTQRSRGQKVGKPKIGKGGRKFGFLNQLIVNCVIASVNVSSSNAASNTEKKRSRGEKVGNPKSGEKESGGKEIQICTLVHHDSRDKS